MNNYSAKKEAEKKMLRHFMSVHSDFPKGKIIESEAPDFILKLTGKRAIGIELIGIFPTFKNEKLSRKDLTEALETALFKKEKKLKSYRKKILNHYWLLITCETSLNSNFNLHNLLERVEFESGFDKVFLFDAVGNKVYFLK